jgi:methylated-DNA-[protein]-cysteine S-methyltransferase
MRRITMNKIYKAFYDSPIGTLEVQGTDEGILSIKFTEEKTQVENVSHVVEECIRQLGEYFEGSLRKFDIKIMSQGTEFQRKVWNELTGIPFGKTAAYKDIARSIGNAKAVRAVGNANGKNPCSIVVPCHRIIGSDGSLTGYAWGLWRKEWLLAHERKEL